MIKARWLTTYEQMAKARPKRGQACTYYPVARNLLLQCSRSKSGGSINRSWVFRYQLRHVRHEMGLGRFADFWPAEAKARARKNRQLLADGVDPLQVKRRFSPARSL
jgi:hypothetical protein